MTEEESYKMRIGYMLGALDQFAYQDFHDHVWLGKDPTRVYSFDEAVETAFSDFGGDALIDSEWRAAGLSTEQQGALVRFRDRLKGFMQRMTGPLAPDEILSDPEWPELSSLAADAIALFGPQYPRRR